MVPKILAEILIMNTLEIEEGNSRNEKNWDWILNFGIRFTAYLYEVKKFASIFYALQYLNLRNELHYQMKL